MKLLIKSVLQKVGFEIVRKDSMKSFPPDFDDYGYWQGCKKAVDEYIRDNNISILLNRIDFTGRIGVKVPL